MADDSAAQQRLEPDQGDVVIGIVAAREVPFGEVVTLMDELRGAGFTHLQFGR